jgi:RNA polymerase sigma-70 factor (ECF subfamily)
MNTEWDDAALVREIGSTSGSEAESELFRRMAPRIRLYGLRHLRDPHAADDLTQQVLLTAIEALRAGRLQDPAKLAAFLLGTCRMMVLDLRRGSQRRERLLSQYGGLFPVLQQPELSLDRERLARCVQGLRERERAVVVLSFYDEAPAAAVARSTGLSEANIRVIRHRALRQLRACMDARQAASSGGTAQ